MYYSFGTSQAVFSAFHGSNVPAVATLRRKRRSATVPNAKKMFEEVSQRYNGSDRFVSELLWRTALASSDLCNAAWRRVKI